MYHFYYYIDVIINNNYNLWLIILIITIIYKKCIQVITVDCIKWPGCVYLLLHNSFEWISSNLEKTLFLWSLCNGVLSNCFVQMKTMAGTLSVHSNSYIAAWWISNSLAFWLQWNARKATTDLDLGLEVCFMSQSLTDHMWPTQGLQHENSSHLLSNWATLCLFIAYFMAKLGRRVAISFD